MVRRKSEKAFERNSENENGNKATGESKFFVMKLIVRIHSKDVQLDHKSW